MQCILCDSVNLKCLEVVSSKVLNAMYKKVFGVDTSKIIIADLKYHHCLDCDVKFFTDLNNKFPTGDNDFYNALNKLDWYYFSEKNEYNYVKNFVSDSSKILEVGCGKAAFVKYIPQNAKSSYIGLELSTEAKKMAQRDGIQIENLSIEEYAEDNKNIFDISCSFQVLEHVSNPKSFLQAQIDCLKISSGGGAI